MKFTDPAQRPRAVAPDLENVPAELKEVKQWILWKYEYKIKTRTWAKIPYTTKGYKASSTDPTTWDMYEACEDVFKRGKYDGLGFVFSASTPYVGVDLDVCLSEVGETLELTPVAAEICAGFDSYTELSPSQTGVHVIGRSTEPLVSAKGTWRGTDCEVYGSGRYFTFTGQVWDGKHTIRDVSRRASELSSLIKQEAAAKSSANSIDRRLARALKDPYIKSLFDGDLSEYENDPSRADLALCSKLAPHAAGKHEVLDAMFRESKLFRDKWDERRGVDTYGNITIAKALEGLGHRSVSTIRANKKPSRHTVDSLWDKVLDFRKEGGARGFHPGWDSLEQFYRPTLGALTVLVGVPSSGKSTWIDCLVYNMARRHGWRTTMASFESLPIERHINALCQIHLQKPTYEFIPGHATDAEMERARKDLNEWFNFILPDDDEYTMEALLEYAQEDIEEFGVKGLVIDPFTELDLGGESDVRVIKDKLGMVQRFTRSNEIHTWLLAHPTKGGDTFKQEEKGLRPTLYSAAGAAHFRNKADFGMVIHRWDDDTVNMYIEKVRNDTTGGNGVVEFKYNAERREYEEMKVDKW